MSIWAELDRVLLRVYAACGLVAAGFLVLLAGLVLASIVGRLLGVYLPGVVEFSGYAMAASSFLALAYGFRRGSHIRVNLVLNRLGGRARFFFEMWCLGAASVITAYLAFYAIKLAWVSYRLEERSEGADAVLLWIPQTAMAAGALVFAVCLTHTLIRVASGVEAAAPESEGAQ